MASLPGHVEALPPILIARQGRHVSRVSRATPVADTDGHAEMHSVMIAQRRLLEHEDLLLKVAQKHQGRLNRLKEQAHYPPRLPPALVQSIERAKERSRRVEDIRSETRRRSVEQQQREQQVR